VKIGESVVTWVPPTGATRVGVVPSAWAGLEDGEGDDGAEGPDGDPPHAAVNAARITAAALLIPPRCCKALMLQ
jgi:hypothetical protein